MTLLEWSALPDTERLRARLRELPVEQVATTVISYEEQMRGWIGYLGKVRSVAQQVGAYSRMRSQLQNYCNITILDFDEIAATWFQRLRQERLRIGTKDMQIA